MNYPSEINQVTPINGEISFFPPSGTTLFEMGNDGAGNYYGLYWQIGREDQEPIVVWMNHEEFTLEPVQTNLNEFLNNYDNESSELTSYPSLKDEQYFLSCFQRGKVKSRKDKNEAVRLFKLASDLFPEFSDSWFWLFKLTEEENIEHKINYAIRTICSNWTFGLPNKQAVDFIVQSRTNGITYDDPIFNIISSSSNTSELLNLKVDAVEFYEIATQYKLKGDFVNYLLMLQNYSYFSNLSRSEFDSERWKNELTEAIERHFPNRKYS
ncbi:hypothetical protein R9C00_21120 [Flammeovirgaceae bacterium SG7u.111]|nr:hypothetical protein [Flammeovirgaceae bacterium SG7u.132]WPO34204.1 hypothetical protein R9C00_21120 [Flammeovirgaceae bacterium SG7u.111]